FALPQTMHFHSPLSPPYELCKLLKTDSAGGFASEAGAPNGVLKTDSAGGFASEAGAPNALLKTDPAGGFASEAGAPNALLKTDSVGGCASIECILVVFVSLLNTCFVSSFVLEFSWWLSFVSIQSYGRISVFILCVNVYRV
ncbi:hypothetical protein TraAM80_09117, partial [Trypanosoma rangeli]